MSIKELLNLVYEYAPVQFEGKYCEVQDFEQKPKFQEAINASLGNLGFPVEIFLTEREKFGKVVLSCEEINDIIVVDLFTDGTFER